MDTFTKSTFSIDVHSAWNNLSEIQCITMLFMEFSIVLEKKIGKSFIGLFQIIGQNVGKQWHFDGSFRWQQHFSGKLAKCFNVLLVTNYGPGVSRLQANNFEDRNYCKFTI